MMDNKEFNEIFKGVDLNKKSSTELLVLVSKIKIMHEKKTQEINEKLDEEEMIVQKYEEIMNIINNRI